MILRTIQCAICGKHETEKRPNGGWPGWMGIIGVALDGDENPQFCPEHTNEIMNFIDNLKHGD